jgi:hypothetical protein
MPKKAMDYSKTIIYKIVCNDLNIKDCYVGYTTNFAKRKTEHKRSVKTLDRNNSYLKLYVVIRENGGWNNWSMIEIEKYSCLDVNEAKKRERYWFELLTPSLNMIYPIRSCLERERQEKYKLSRKKWYEQNKNKILSNNINEETKSVVGTREAICYEA